VDGIPHAMRISGKDMPSQAWLAFSEIKIAQKLAEPA